MSQGTRQSSVFQYTESWPAGRERFMISTDLPLLPDRQFCKAPGRNASVFHFAIADTTPDGWGCRVIARDHARRRSQAGATPGAAESRALNELDYLLGVDEGERGAETERDLHHLRHLRAAARRWAACGPSARSLTSTGTWRSASARAHAYTEIAERILSVAPDPRRALAELWRRIAYHMLITNVDDRSIDDALDAAPHSAPGKAAPGRLTPFSLQAHTHSMAGDTLPRPHQRAGVRASRRDSAPLQAATPKPMPLTPTLSR